MRDQQTGHQPTTSGGNGTDEKNGTVWALIEPCTLIREALIGMIVAAGSPPIIGTASTEELVARVSGSGQCVSLVMLHAVGSLGNGAHIWRECSLLRASLDGVPVAVLRDCVDLGDVGHAFRAGARGYIPTSNTCRTVMSALQHVEAGNVYVPEEILSGFLHTAQDVTHRMRREVTSLNRRFTPRQIEVLTLLREGKPNKIIAHELKIQESTVKVHVREIMKKLKVTNRTEAAFRAGQLLANLNGQDGGTNGTGSLRVTER